MDVVQVSLRRKLCGLVWLNHPLTINDELVPCRATVWHLDGSRKGVFADRESERDLDHLSKSPVTITDWAVVEGLEKSSEREGDNAFRSIPLNDELV